jgi:glycosyltransferase involved in cell wall biosynthesis
LRIAVATAGRFHVLDLARELAALGHEVRFYSYVPQGRARLFGLADKHHVGLLPFVSPILAWERSAPRVAPVWRERAMNLTLNRAVMLRLRPCDVFIGMSGIYLEAAQYARRRFGARIWLERGSRHILSQDEILAATPGAQRPSPYVIDRELAGYALADRIAVPSAHVAESFRRDELAYAKLFRDPYGVDLAMFPYHACRPGRAAFTVLFTGTWSLQKGCDLLAEAVARSPDIQLTHVGSLGDLAFPEGPRFQHVDAVPQAQLSRYYAQADAFVLASRQEGLSLVQSQALASGLPLICTDRTGGADLAHTPNLAARIRVVPSGDVDALVAAISAVRDQIRGHAPLPPLTEADRQTLSWTAYARRYDDELQRDVAGA